MGAEEGYAAGLISEIVDAPEEVLSYARALALRIIQHAPLTIWAAKEALLRVYDKLQSVQFFDVIEQCYGSNDFRLGVNSFIKRETPQWSGG
jgi:enoyl-CoA hydratase